MRVTDFDFYLPSTQIAQRPPAAREDARMLRLERLTGGWHDAYFRDLPSCLMPGDLLVVNDTKVIPARLFGRRAGVRTQLLSPQNPAAKEYLTGKVEVLLTSEVSANEWKALVRPGKKVNVGERITFGDGELHAEVIARGEYGERTMRFDVADRAQLMAALRRLGHIPLPPYIDREDQPEDRERYQTTYARREGSVAAPTAGLHFTPGIMAEIRSRGVEVVPVTLDVGLGTFAPLRHESVAENRLHRERFEISAATADAVVAAKREGRRLVAVGTTTVRTLEYSAMVNGEVRAGGGEADIFIYPGFEFKVVDAMLTNFHLPKSSLLMLVAAFAGREHVLRAYEHAVQAGYRFFSYGDCMFISDQNR